MDLRVDKQPEGAGLRVTTPHAHVDVVGTVFSVDVSKTPDTKTQPGGKDNPHDFEISNLKSEIPRTRVETYEGRVRVTRKVDSRTCMLAVGQHLCVTDSTDKKLAAADISGWAGIRKGPDGEILRRFVWDLAGKGSQGLELVKGRWKWHETEYGKPFGGMEVGKEPVIFMLPARLTGRPCKVFITSYDVGRREERTLFGIVLGTARKAHPFRQWFGKVDMGWKRIIDIWVNGSCSLTAVYYYNPKRFGQYMREYTGPPDAVHLTAKNTGIQRISMEEVPTATLPEALRSDKAWETLKKAMSWYRCTWDGRDTGIVKNPATHGSFKKKNNYL